MKTIAELSVVPIGVEVSVSRYVRECLKILETTGLRMQVHANGTNLEGELDDVFAAVKKCHEAVHAMGPVRVTSLLKLDTRTDKSQTMEDKVRSAKNNG